MNETDTLEEGTAAPIVPDEIVPDEEEVLSSKAAFDYSEHKVKVNNAKITGYLKYLGADLELGEVSYKWLAENLSSMKITEDNVLSSATILPGATSFCIPGTSIYAMPIMQDIFGKDVKIWASRSSNTTHTKFPDDPETFKIIYPSQSISAREILECSEHPVGFTIRRCGAGYISPGSDAATAFPPDKKIAIYLNPDLTLTFELFTQDHVNAMKRSSRTPNLFLFPNRTILFNMTCNSRARYISDDLIEVMKKIFKHVKDFYDMDPAELQSKFDDMKNMEVLTALRRIFEGTLQATQTNFHNIAQSLERAKSTLASATQQYEMLRSQLENAEAFVDKEVNKMLENIRTIRKTAFVKDINVDSNAILTVTTTPVPIFISEEDARHVANRFRPEQQESIEKEYGPFNACRVGGPYIIAINLHTKSIKFLPTDETPLYHGLWSGSPHPHVSGSGDACWGNAVEPIAELQAQHEYPFLVDFLLDYLQSVNVRDPAGREYYKWALLKEDPESDSKSP